MARPLPAEKWAAIRAAFELGLISVRALARQFSVDHKTILARAEREGWKVDPDAQARTDEAAKKAMKKTLMKGPMPAVPPIPPPAPPASPQVPPPAEPVSMAEMMGLSPEAMQRHAARLLTDEVKDQAIEGYAALIVQANIEQLHRLVPLKRIQAQLADAMALATRPLGPEDLKDPELELRRNEARGIILMGESSGLPSALNALVKLTESIQAQERRALGVEDRPKRIEHSGPNGGLIPVGATTGVEGRPRLRDFDTCQLEVLMQAVALLDGAQQRPDVPLPPGMRPAA